MYQKTQPEIEYDIFLKLVLPVESFRSLRGKEYIVKGIDGSIISFIRKSTNTKWSMDLKQVHAAYRELKDFKTVNFKTYVPLTHSPALGILLSLKLLVK